MGLLDIFCISSGFSSSFRTKVFLIFFLFQEQLDDRHGDLRLLDGQPQNSGLSRGVFAFSRQKAHIAEFPGIRRVPEDNLGRIIDMFPPWFVPRIKFSTVVIGWLKYNENAEMGSTSLLDIGPFAPQPQTKNEIIESSGEEDRADLGREQRLVQMGVPFRPRRRQGPIAPDFQISGQKHKAAVLCRDALDEY
jgi:hypothetical protein